MRIRTIAAGFALFHGYAHGLEMPQAASPMLYALGFVLTTAFLHGVGIAGSLIGRHVMQVAGAAIAARPGDAVRNVSRWTINYSVCWRPKPARRR